MNKYDLSGEYGKGYFKKGDDYFLFDKEDYDKIKNITWCKRYDDYVVSNKLRLHRVIMDCPKDMLIDHINHNVLDNRKCNLRICTKKQNAYNCKIKKGNTSGISGVCFDKTVNVWKARIKIDGKNIFLGSSKDKEKAILLRKEAEKRYFGKFAYKESSL